MNWPVLLNRGLQYYFWGSFVRYNWLIDYTCVNYSTSAINFTSSEQSNFFNDNVKVFLTV